MVDKPLILHVRADAERSVRFGHPWLYPQSIRTQDRPGHSGDLAVVYDGRNRFLALGLYDPSSPIRVRILQRHHPAAIDAAWMRAKLSAAIARRAPLAAEASTTAYRLVHGENDGLPGVVLDRYDRTLVLKLYTAAWAPHVALLQEAVDAVAEPHALVLRLSRGANGAGPWPAGLTDGAVLKGRVPAGRVRFLERGLRFEADVLRGQKTGFFLDQRDNRAKVETLSRNRKVLDLFAYTGGCSVAAARGGAAEVTSIDVNRQALAMVTRNWALNRTHPSVVRASHRLIADDGFEALAHLAKRGIGYDLVLLDPPSFATAKGQAAKALVAYERLTTLSLGVLAPGGVLMISCCSGQLSEKDFAAAVHRAARRAHWQLTELACTGHPLDHPIGFPEGAYLKTLFAHGQPLRRRARG